MRILMMTQCFPPEPGSASMWMLEFADYLTCQGHKITVLTGFPNYPTGIIYEGYKGKVYQREEVKGVTVIRTFVYTSPQRKKFLPRLMNYISLMITSLFGALVAGKHNLIYVYSPPPFLGLSAFVIGKIYRIPFIIELNDLWPQGPIALGVIKNRYLIKLAEAIEKFIYAKAKKVFVYSHRMGQDIIGRGTPAKKVKLHSLGVDTDSFRPQTQNKQIREQYQLNNKLVVMYAGLIGLSQGLEQVIECARLLQERKEIIFVLVGDGVEKEKLIQKKEDCHLENVKFIPQQPKEAISQFLSAADVLLVHLNKAPHRLGTIPAKTLAYMACGRPVLMAVEGESADLIKQHECGIVVEPQNPKAMAEAILNLCEDKELRENLGKNARESAVKYFDQKALLRKRKNSLQEIIKDNLGA